MAWAAAAVLTTQGDGAPEGGERPPHSAGPLPSPGPNGRKPISSMKPGAFRSAAAVLDPPSGGRSPWLRSTSGGITRETAGHVNDPAEHGWRGRVAASGP